METLAPKSNWETVIKNTLNCNYSDISKLINFNNSLNLLYDQKWHWILHWHLLCLFIYFTVRDSPAFAAHCARRRALVACCFFAPSSSLALFAWRAVFVVEPKCADRSERVGKQKQIPPVCAPRNCFVFSYSVQCVLLSIYNIIRREVALIACSEVSLNSESRQVDY